MTNNEFSGKIFTLESKSNNEVDLLAAIKKIIDESKSLSIGGIVFNSRVHELLTLVDRLDTNERKKVRLIRYDAIRKNVETLKENKVSFLIAQHSENQGYEGIRSLSNYLLFKQSSAKDNLMPIDILIKENIDYYNNYKL